MKLSVVVPCHNEEEVIEETHYILKKILDELITNKEILEYEMIFVNNGSTDQTLNKMIKIFENDSSLVIIDLRKNYGYQGSITAGIFHSTGDAVITIDADLQDDPYKIPEMVKLYKQGYEMVLGVRKDRSKDSFFKRMTANLYYDLLKFLGVNCVKNHGDFRLLSRKLVEEFKNLPERNRFIRAMILELESTYGCVYYDRRVRKRGKTKFNISALIAFAIDGITSFTSAPIKIVTFFGFVTFMLSIIGSLYVFNEKFIRKVDVPGWAFLSILILFFGGIQSLFLGIVGEYISKTYMEIKKRPIFLVRRIYKKG